MDLSAGSWRISTIRSRCQGTVVDTADWKRLSGCYGDLWSVVISGGAVITCSSESVWYNHPHHHQWLYSLLLGPGLFFRFVIRYTVDRTPCTGDQSVARPLPTHRTAQTQNTRTQTSMPQVGFEITTPVFKRTKTVQALDRAATVIGVGVIYVVNKAKYPLHTPAIITHTTLLFWPQICLLICAHLIDITK
jgi:hypothetical protein